MDRAAANCLPRSRSASLRSASFSAADTIFSRVTAFCVLGFHLGQRRGTVAGHDRGKKVDDAATIGKAKHRVDAFGQDGTAAMGDRLIEE
jgi:hypothetical protein